MDITKSILVAVIIILSLTVGYLREKKKRLIALVILGVVLAFYIVYTQNG